MTRAALVVSHGQPLEPAPAEAELARLAGRIAEYLPGWRVGAATLADPAALPRAVAALGPGGRVFPLFMAGGWFTRVHLPARLAAAGAVDWTVLEPLGCLTDLHDLAVRIARDEGGEVLLAAHGSGKSAVPADIAAHVAGLIGRATARRSEAAFIDHAPQLQAVRGFGPGAVCLPFFAAQGGHVSEDIPAALQIAGFQGRILPAIGLHPEVPAIIARAVERGELVCASGCRWRDTGPKMA